MIGRQLGVIIFEFSLLKILNGDSESLKLLFFRFSIRFRTIFRPFDAHNLLAAKLDGITRSEDMLHTRY